MPALPCAELDDPFIRCYRVAWSAGELRVQPAPAEPKPQGTRFSGTQVAALLRASAGAPRARTACVPRGLPLRPELRCAASATHASHPRAGAGAVSAEDAVAVAVRLLALYRLLPLPVQLGLRIKNLHLPVVGVRMATQPAARRARGSTLQAGNEPHGSIWMPRTLPAGAPVEGPPEPRPAPLRCPCRRTGAMAGCMR